MSRPKSPFIIDETAGTKAICSCGQSKNLPYCDGSHKGSGKSPVIVKLETSKKVAWCGCGMSDNFPYCDGTHSKA